AVKAKAAADAEAAAEASARSAAQIVADRLPSLHDPNSPGATSTTAAGTNPAAPPISTVPRPLPTIHPDRYTPGDTPPAASMTPGARNRFENNVVPAPELPANAPRQATQKPRVTTPPSETPAEPLN
ncbi:MAG: rod shape-determining protein MreC, partial [Edaphobacter sp.]